jgi:hypothetical protein
MSSVESVLAELTLGPPPDARSVAAACERHGVSEADATALLESLPRLAVYRELVRGNLLEAMRLSIPRTIARLGAVFEAYFDRFLAEQGPRTHYLRDVTTELLDFCAPLWEADPRVPAYALELARHEALHIQVSAMPTPPVGHVAAGLALDQGVQLSAALRLVRYSHAVHELPEAEDDRSEAARRAVSLLVYRSPEHDVRYLELTPLAYGIVWRLLQGEALGSAVREAAAGEGAALSEAVLSGAAQLLADLAARGVVWGARAPANQPDAAPEP